MLAYAFQHKSELMKARAKSLSLDKNKYFYSNGFTDYTLDIEESDWNKLQMVSVLECGAVIGYFNSSFDRPSKKASGIEAINYSFKNNVVFARDLYAFLDGLFVNYGLNKIEWSVLIGNPIEAMYDRVAKRYGGNAFGLAHQACALKDGTLCDVKYYELMRCEYMQHRR